MNVERLMTRTVWTCAPEDVLSHPAQIMWESDVGCVPVVDREQRVIGIITDRDIAMAAHLRGLKLQGMAVKDVMQWPVHSCRPEDSVTQVENIMRHHQVRRLPVTDADGRLVGLVSLNDLALEGGKDGVALSSVATTLADISRHRAETLMRAAHE